MNPEWFAPRLKELRESKGWTQQELADAAGMKLGGVRNLEQGRTYPEWPSVLALAQALGVSCEDFQTAPAPKSGKTKKATGLGRPKKAK